MSCLVLPSLVLLSYTVRHCTVAVIKTQVHCTVTVGNLEGMIRVVIVLSCDCLVLSCDVLSSLPLRVVSFLVSSCLGAVLRSLLVLCTVLSLCLCCLVLVCLYAVVCHHSEQATNRTEMDVERGLAVRSYRDNQAMARTGNK